MIFLTGGFSHVDTFDYKPALNQYHGKPVPSFGLRSDETGNRPLLGSPFRFRQCGQSGLWVSELFPNLGVLADDLCVIRSLHTDIVEHFQAVLAMHTGSATVPLPSLGAWLSYGLGTHNAVVALVHGALRAHALRRQPGVGQQFPAAHSPGRANRSRGRPDSRPASSRAVAVAARTRADDASRRERAACGIAPGRRRPSRQDLPRSTWPEA